MANQLSGELTSVAERLRATVSQADSEPLTALLAGYEAAANRLEQAWSGSNLGYHSRVYYADFHQPPPGAMFSAEWGDTQVFTRATIGDWREFSRDDLHEAIIRLVGGADFTPATAARTTISAAIESARGDAVSLLTTALKGGDDEYLRSLKGSIEETKALSKSDGIRGQLPNGQLFTRDARAIQGGLESAVHQELLADVVSVRHAFSVATDMATLIERAATHLERESSRRTLHPEPRLSGNRIFIGHGHSPLWRQLKDFLHDRLGLPWEEFNRIPAAGITNVARLSEMLDNAVLSFHVLTAEDERKDGTQVARLNVVHEAGLFQGKLGFTRAIVILEEGCEEYSNIHGLGQIRFPTGHIEAAYEEVRRVLEREAILLKGDS